MNKELYRVLMVTLLMIFSSLAGCLEGSDDDEKTDSDTGNDNNDGSQGNNTDMGGNNSTVVVNYGTVMVSTYHVGELVSAIVGDSATIEYMADPDTSVHDYTPSDADKIRLTNSDIFFYHGLNLEPWVDDLLDNLGDAAPPAIQTHTMPSGELSLDYESLLKMSLCEELTMGEETSSTLIEHEENASDLEIHAEKGLQKLMFPEHDDDHDEDHDDDMEDEESILMGIFNESDTNGDNLLDIDELENFITALDAFEEEHEDDHDGHDHGDGHDDGDEHDHGDGHDDGDEHDHGDGHDDGDEHDHGDGHDHEDGHDDGDNHTDGDDHDHDDGHDDGDNHTDGDDHDHEDGPR